MSDDPLESIPEDWRIAVLLNEMAPFGDRALLTGDQSARDVFHTLNVQCRAWTERVMRESGNDPAVYGPIIQRMQDLAYQFRHEGDQAEG